MWSWAADDVNHIYLFCLLSHDLDWLEIVNYLVYEVSGLMFLSTDEEAQLVKTCPGAAALFRRGWRNW